MVRSGRPGVQRRLAGGVRVVGTVVASGVLIDVPSGVGTSAAEGDCAASGAATPTTVTRLPGLRWRRWRR